MQPHGAGVANRPKHKDALLYGAGDSKIGSIKKQDCIDAKQPVPKGDLAKLGKDLKKQFFAKLPALGRLRDGIKARVEQRGYLIGLDGRILHVRSAHAALNTLLQSCGAILMKRALIEQYDILTNNGYTWGRDFAFVANIHDEVQSSVRPEIAEVVGKSGPEALRIAGEKLRFKVRLDGEYKVGPSWADTH
jgi:DNA polymerase I